MFYQLLSFLATPVLADDYGLKATADAAALSNFGDNLPGFIGNALGTALSLVGVLFFALMLYGGITWMMAHGNAEQEKKALSTITAAIIGILIVLGSYALTSFVLGSVKGGGVGDSAPNNSSTAKKCVPKSETELQKICDDWFKNSPECPAGPISCSGIIKDKKCVGQEIVWSIVEEACKAKIEKDCLEQTDPICEWK